MKKLIFIPLLLFCVSAFGQFTKPQLYSNINTNIRLKTASQLRTAAVLDSIVKSMSLVGGGSMVYPGAGIPLSTGSSWGTSITDNSANWNTAFGWGNHASAGYIKLGTPVTQEFTGDKLLGGSDSFALNLGYIGSALGSFSAVSIGSSALLSNSTYGGEVVASDDPTGTKIASGPYNLNPQQEPTLGDGLAQISSSGYAGNFVIGKSSFLNSGNPYVIFNLTPSSDATGDIYQRNASGYFSRLPAVSAGSFLRSGGVATVNAWSTVKLPDTMSALGLWVANVANTPLSLTATANQSIRINSGGTAWEAYTPSTGTGDMLLGTIQIVTARKDFNTGTFSLFNPANTFKYNFLGSAIVADRTVTLPLLTGNDTFVMNDFGATLTNKTINLTSNTLSGTTAQFNTALSDNDFATLIGTEQLQNKTLGSGTFWSAAPSITDGLTIVFNPNGTQSGFNFGGHTVNPSVGNPGDAFYDTDDFEFSFNDGTAWRNVLLHDKIQTITNKVISPISNTIRTPIKTESGTTYTLVAGDENYTIEFTNASPITITLPNGLSQYFSCSIIKAGTGNITISATGTLESTATTIETQYSGAWVQHKGSNVWVAYGALGSTGGGSGDVVGPASSTDNTLAIFDGATGKLIGEAVSSGLRLKSDGTDLQWSKDSPVSGNNFIRAASGISGSTAGLGLLLRGGYGFASGNTDAGDVIIQAGIPNGSGAVGAVKIAETTDKLSFFNVTPVVKQSSVTTSQGIADALTAYGLLPSSTISGGSGLTYSQTKAIAMKIR